MKHEALVQNPQCNSSLHVANLQATVVLYSAVVEYYSHKNVVLRNSTTCMPDQQV